MFHAYIANKINCSKFCYDWYISYDAGEVQSLSSLITMKSDFDDIAALPRLQVIAIIVVLFFATGSKISKV